MLKVYWNQEGKYQEELKKIKATLPTFGKTNNKYLNLFLTAAVIYYDVYDNNGGNIKYCCMNDINEYIYPFTDYLKAINFKVSDNTIIRNLKNKEKLEKFLDEVILFIKDKDLSCDKYAIYIEFEKQQLSHTEKEGFSEVSFGNKKDYDDWIINRLNVLKYELLLW